MLNMINRCYYCSTFKEINMELKIIKTKKQYQEDLDWVDKQFDKKTR